MSIRVKSLNGLGALSGVTAMKTALNQLELATGRTGRYNAGDATKSSLSGNAGLFVFQATYHLIIDASNTTSELVGMVSALAGGLSSTLGDVLSVTDDFTRQAASAVADNIGHLDKGIGSITVAFALWNADQLADTRYIQGFLEDFASEIATLASVYLKAKSFGGSSASAPALPTEPNGSIDKPLTRIQQLRQKHGAKAPAITSQEVFVPRPPVRKAAPVLIIGGAAAAAAALLFIK